MAISRIEKSKNYSVMSNIALNDKNLSLKAKGLFAYLMSKPDEWAFSYRTLELQLPEGKTAIMSALIELEKAGYLVRSQARKKDDGTFTSSENVLHEIPQITVGGFPVHGKPEHLVNTEEQISTKTLRGAQAQPPKAKTKPSTSNLVAQEAGTADSTTIAPLTICDFHVKDGKPGANCRACGTNQRTINAIADDSKPLTIKKLYYDVVAKYGLPVSNHTVLQAKIKALEKEAVATARGYLTVLLQFDWNALEGDFKPIIGNALDVYSKRINILTFLQNNRPTLQHQLPTDAEAEEMERRRQQENREAFGNGAE